MNSRHCYTSEADLLITKRNFYAIPLATRYSDSEGVDGISLCWARVINLIESTIFPRSFVLSFLGVSTCSIAFGHACTQTQMHTYVRTYARRYTRLLVRAPIFHLRRSNRRKHTCSVCRKISKQKIVHWDCARYHEAGREIRIVLE